MKVEKSIVKPDFQPVELKLVFESEEELEVFHHMMYNSGHVASVFYREDTTHYRTLRALMSRIYYKLQM